MGTTGKVCFAEFVVSVAGIDAPFLEVERLGRSLKALVEAELCRPGNACLGFRNAFDTDVDVELAWTATNSKE
jgi:hypothetical protein